MNMTMRNTAKILLQKISFFLNRATHYTLLLIIPAWAPKYFTLTRSWEFLIIFLYIIFLAGQWYLLGKEIDHRFKIYFRVNSSIDRVIYRLILGYIFMIFFFCLVSYVPTAMIRHFYWGFWIVFGLFYSWPTRGKIIEESVSQQFGEFKFLDSFEKTLLLLVIIFFIVSLPAFPQFNDTNHLRAVLDSSTRLSSQFWNFFKVNYYLFRKYPNIYYMAIGVHFYVVGLGLFLLASYGILRVFFHRRIALLGVFALISSWSYSKILESNPHYALTTTFVVLWIWSLVWALKSSTYRSGLLLGMLSYLGVMIDISFLWLIFIQFLLIFVFLKDKTRWFKLQLLKYSFFGILLAIIIFFTEDIPIFSSFSFQYNLWPSLLVSFKSKSFYIVSLVGFSLLLVRFLGGKKHFNKIVILMEERMLIIVLSVLILFLYSMIINAQLMGGFSLIWMFSFLSLLPIGWIFESMTQSRSKRNMIYVFYILVCLLDSHVEGRVKIFLKIFNGT